MESSFKTFTIITIAALLVSVVLHVFLLSSDSPEYRSWIFVQMAIQVLGVGLLVFAHNYKFLALVFVIVLSVPFAYINARFVNYSNETVHTIFFIAFWTVYGFLIYGVRHKFIEEN